MPKYIIEREIPNAAALSAADLKNISQRSCAVPQQFGPNGGPDPCACVCQVLPSGMRSGSSGVASDRCAQAASLITFSVCG